MKILITTLLIFIGVNSLAQIDSIAVLKEQYEKRKDSIVKLMKERRRVYYGPRRRWSQMDSTRSYAIEKLKGNIYVLDKPYMKFELGDEKNQSILK